MTVNGIQRDTLTGRSVGLRQRFFPRRVHQLSQGSYSAEVESSKEGGKRCLPLLEKEGHLLLLLSVKM